MFLRGCSFAIIEFIISFFIFIYGGYMKTSSNSVQLTFMMLVFLVLLSPLKGQIANSFPGDINIESDPNVVFSEMFEQNSISTMISSSGYQTSQMVSHITFDPSVPIGSTGKQSLKLTTIESSNASNDKNEDANILKKFSTGISDSVFVRYYVKFNNAHTFHHTGVWIGGTNPANTCWPCNIPGRSIPTNGDSAFVVGTEIRGAANKSAQAFSKFGFYNYWADMKPFTSGPNAGQYYGNEFISPNSSASIDMNAWNCIEIMIKLNNPVSESSGELKLWINGQLIAHYGKGFPNGTWNEAIFNEGAGAPFEGFKWRNNPSVVFNYIWIKNYSTNNTAYPSANDVLYDHIVVAKKYIGPIATALPLPLPVSLSAPDNRSIQNENSVKLMWTKEPSSDTYELELASDVGFTHMISTQTTNNTYFVFDNVIDGNEYYWRVRAKNETGWGNYSDVWSFHYSIPLQIPSPCLLVAPANGSEIQDAEITLFWNKSSQNPNGYQLQIAENFTFSQMSVSDSTLTDTTFIHSNLKANQDYYWRVRARNKTGWGDYSDVRSYKKQSINSVQITTDDENAILYPNPASNTIIIRSNSIPYSFTLYNLLGDKVLFGNSTTQESQLPTDKLAAGTYRLIIQSGNSQKVFQLIKQ